MKLPRRRRKVSRETQTAVRADGKTYRDGRPVDDAYPYEYIGPSTAFGLSPGPCDVERPWAGGGCIIRTVDGRRWTVARKFVCPTSRFDAH